MTERIEIECPKNTGDELKDHLKNLVEIFQCSSASLDDEIILHMKKVRWVTPSMIATLAALKDKYKNLSFDLFIDSPVWNYLGIVTFPKGIRSLSTLDSYNSSYIPLLKVTSLVDAYEANAMESLFHEMLLRRCNVHINALNAFQMPISELALNCREHSESETYMFAQHFRTKGYLEVSIVDAGVGLKGSYAKVSKNYSHLNALQACLVGESSKGFQGDRGYGIPTSQKAILALGGEMMLISGNHAAIINQNGTEIIDLQESQWNGLIVTLRIPDRIDYAVGLESII